MAPVPESFQWSADLVPTVVHGDILSFVTALDENGVLEAAG